MPVAKKVTNIKELRDDLLNTYDGLESKKMPLNMAKEKANTAGKILNSLKLELDYNEKRKYNKKIDFLEV
jgi:hypothetical protein